MTLFTFELTWGMVGGAALWWPLLLRRPPLVSLLSPAAAPSRTGATEAVRDELESELVELALDSGPPEAVASACLRAADAAPQGMGSPGNAFLRPRYDERTSGRG